MNKKEEKEMREKFEAMTDDERYSEQHRLKRQVSKLSATLDGLESCRLRLANTLSKIAQHEETIADSKMLIAEFKKQQKLIEKESELFLS